MSEDIAAYNISPSRAIAAHLIEIADQVPMLDWCRGRAGQRFWCVPEFDIQYDDWLVLPGQGIFDGAIIAKEDGWQVREGYVVVRLLEVPWPGLAGE